MLGAVAEVLLDLLDGRDVNDQAILGFGLIGIAAHAGGLQVAAEILHEFVDGLGVLGGVVVEVHPLGLVLLQQGLHLLLVEAKLVR